MAFEAHGRWQLEICNSILVQSFYGSWNEEAVIKYAAEFKEFVQPLVAKHHWAILSIFEDWELATPDIAPHVEQHCRWFIEHGVSHDCHVYSRNLVKQEQLDNMIPYSEPGYERRMFTSINQAVDWLESHYFIVENSKILAKYGFDESNR